MTDSTNTRTLSRRKALIGASTGIAAATIAGGAALAMTPAATAIAGPDAELVEMCQRWIRLNRAWEHTDQRAADAEEDKDAARHELLMSVGDRIYDGKMVPLAQAIADLPAASWAGVTAKAQMLANDPSFSDAYGPCGVDFPFALEPVAVSLIEDAVRLDGMPLPARVKARQAKV